MEREINYKKLEKGAKHCMRISSMLIWAILLLTTFCFLYFLGYLENGPAMLIYGVVAVLALLYIILVPEVRYERYRYAMDEEAIRVREGFLWVEESIVPIERLHKLSVSQGPIDRIFKLSKVEVTTAGGDVTIKFLKENEAAEVTKTLEKKINLMAVEQRERSCIENNESVCEKLLNGQETVTNKKGSSIEAEAYQTHHTTKEEQLM